MFHPKPENFCHGSQKSDYYLFLHGKNQYFFCKFDPHFSLKTAGSFIVLHCSGQLLYFVLKNAKEIKKKKNTASPKS